MVSGQVRTNITLIQVKVKEEDTLNGSSVVQRILNLNALKLLQIKVKWIGLSRKIMLKQKRGNHKIGIVTR